MLKNAFSALYLLNRLMAADISLGDAKEAVRFW